MLHLAWLLAGLAGGAHAASFSDVLPGARSMGMGQAYTSVADDLSAMWVNPGGLAGTDFTAIGGSVGRMFGEHGPLAFYAANYARPFPLREESVVGSGYFALRESAGGRPKGGDRDAFYLHYSEPVKLPQLYLTRPLKAGGNVKVVAIDGGAKGAKTTLGLDAGVLAESNFGLKGGLAVVDLLQDVGIPAPTIAFGLSYLFRDRFTFAGELRVRQGLTEFYPGIEVSFLQGLLKARAGKGMRYDGSQVALGAGINFSPVIVDFAVTLPWAGSTRNGGAYQMSLSYRFDAPPFYGRFVGSAARQAEDLKSQLLELEDKKRTLDAQVTAAEASRQSLDGQLRSMESRARSLQEQLRSLEIKVDENRYQLEAPKAASMPPAPTPAPKPAGVMQKPAPAPYPRKHAVAVGDTLRSIAAQHYGDPSLWEAVYNANPGKIDRGLPREGELLLIPAPPRGSR